MSEHLTSVETEWGKGEVMRPVRTWTDEDGKFWMEVERNPNVTGPHWTEAISDAACDAADATKEQHHGED